jgi:tetratricopeptide (TPR) repeat protein
MKVALIALCSLALASTARAEEVLRPDQIPQRARELADKGRAFHDAGDYPSAIAAYKEAYVLAPSAGLLFNLAQAYRLAGNCDDAAWMYHRYLDTNPRSPRRALAETHLATVERCRKSQLHLAVDPGALPPDPPLPREPYVAPSVPVAIQTTTDETAGQREKQIGIWLAISGGVSMIGAGVFALDAHDASNTVEELSRRGAKWQDIKSVDDRGRLSSTLAAVFGIGGVATAATGGVLYALGLRSEKARHLSIAPSAHGGQVSLAWTF